MIARRWFAAACCFCCVSAVHAQASRVRGQGGEILIAANRLRHRIQMPAGVGVDMDTVEVLDSQQIRASTYLLLTVSGPSRRNAGGVGVCGAGVETAIVWLQLTDWRIQRRQSQLVESCVTDVAVARAIEWRGDTLSLAFFRAAPHSTMQMLRYDRSAPESGFVVAPGLRGK